jgi:hypothetical protein
LLLGVLLLAAACSSAARPTPAGERLDPQVPVARGGALTNRIGVPAFQLKSILGDETIRNSFEENLMRAVRLECGQLLFVTPDETDFPPGLAQPPLLADGRIDNSTLAQIGRQKGLQAVLVGTILGIGTEEKEEGLWLLAEMHYYITMEVLVEIYDTETAAKIMDRSLSHKVEVDQPDIEIVRYRKKVDAFYLEESIDVLSEELKEEICETLSDQRWKGYITEVDGRRVRISSGSRVGLRAGQLLEVFGSGGEISGAAGLRYRMPGGKVGELQVIDAQAAEAVAAVLNGENLEAGNVVRPID